MLVSLIIIWGVFVKVTLIERDVTLERTKQQLETMISTLADFNELAEKTQAINVEKEETQRAAVWNALLRYPTANIWVESNGVVSSGQPTKGDLNTFIVAHINREHFNVHATIPIADVLVDWRHESWQRCGVLVLISLVFIVLTQLLSRALKQRSMAEQKMRAANILLQEELVSRKTAEKELREHDALLNAITQGATELLGAQSYEKAIVAVLALIGDTVSVSWIHLNLITSESEDINQSISLRYEWCAPGMSAMINNPELKNLDLASQFHKMISASKFNETASFYTDELPSMYRKPLVKFHMQSFLYIPILIGDKPEGSLHFIDSSSVKRQWNWAETDALKIFAGLIGMTIARMRYVKELADANRRAGMAEIANNVLHNVGNVLNSVNISVNMITDNLKESKLSSLGKVIEIVHEHKTDLGAYLNDDPKGKILPKYLTQFYEYLVTNQKKNLEELSSLHKSIEHINNIISMQQAYTGATVVLEMVDIQNLIEESLRISVISSADAEIEIVREFDTAPLINLDKHKVLQILVNLINNAKHACNDSGQVIKRIKICLYKTKEYVHISVIDNGIGIAAENLNRIFNHGFTTRETGHGFGLHNSVLAAKEMGGRLSVRSDGIGKGATLTLELPLS
jgi:signal transduction histidine kinase